MCHKRRDAAVFRDAKLMTNEFANRRHAKRCASPGNGHTADMLATWGESVEAGLSIFLETDG
jgi:hypothetical protein